MRVLLTGTEGSGIDRAEHQLRAAGHKVLTCVPEDETIRCKGCAENETCPVFGGVDLIVAARQHPLPHLVPNEQLASCALLTSVPLVVAGSTVLNPFGHRATTLVEGFDGLVEACEEATSRTAHRVPA